MSAGGGAQKTNYGAISASLAEDRAVVTQYEPTIGRTADHGGAPCRRAARIQQNACEGRGSSPPVSDEGAVDLTCLQKRASAPAVLHRPSHAGVSSNEFTSRPPSRIIRMNDAPASQFGYADRVQGFVDLLGTCGQWPPASPERSGADGYLSGRRRLPLPAGPITVEFARFDGPASGAGSLPGDEFVLVLEGDIAFEQSGARLRLGAGEAGVVLRDMPLDWSSDEGCRLIVVRCTAGGGAGADAPVRIEHDAPLAPSNPPLPDVLIGPSPQCRNHTDYRSASGEFVCGTWDSTPYHRRLISFPHYELMRLLEGSVTFVDAAGRSGHFGAGDVVLIEQGGGASWESREHVKKIYCTYRPAQ
jgi:uncharacterized cupin superfamily protein